MEAGEDEALPAPVEVEEPEEPEEPDEPEPDDPDEPEGEGVSDATAALPLTEIAASVAPALPEIILPEGFCPCGEVALVAMAIDWKSSKLFAAVGLIAKTIPA